MLLMNNVSCNLSCLFVLVIYLYQECIMNALALTIAGCHFVFSMYASSGSMCSCGASPAAVWLPLVNGSMCTCIQHNILPLVNNGSMYVHVCNTIYMLCSKPVYISQPLTCTVICCIPKRAIDLELYNMFSLG